MSQIIKFPGQNDNYKGKRKINWVLIMPVISALITLCGNVVYNNYTNRKSEVQSKPTINLSAHYYEDEYYDDIYLDPRGRYMDAISIKMSDKNTESVSLTVEPFYNVIYYNQSQHTIIKQMIPICDLKGMHSYSPLAVENLNTKNDTIAKIAFNDNTYNILYSLASVFVDSEDIIYNDYLSNLFDDSIIASIDFEFYLTIDYMDIYQNNFSEVYLCETGFRNYSGYLTDYVFRDDNIDLDEDIIKYNISCSAEYVSLKANYMENIEFDAKLSQIKNDDLFYNEFHNFYSGIINKPGCIIYVPKIMEDLDDLLLRAYYEKQLFFMVDVENAEWRKCE